MRSRIMVSGIYTSGGANAAKRTANFAAMNRASVTVFRKGCLPQIGVNMALPAIVSEGAESFDELMMPVSLELSERCDATSRVGRESKGADEEMNRFVARGLPVYRDPLEVPEIERP